MVAILAVITIYAIVGGFGYTSQSRDNMGSVMGFFADVSAICMYAAPMEKLLQVLKYRSAAFINAHMVIAGLTNNCLWFTYGILTDNWFIISPNIIFISLNTFTLVLCLVFDPKTHPLPEDFHVRGDDEDDAASAVVERTPKSPSCKGDSALPSPAFAAMHSPLECIQVSK
ncbi:MtN3-like protein [Phytophthora cinnamomi]|uniref:MtN3-like protein n=1 Tax=Phytophthora cinnamomi TaxID=4785 RepID=UPI003559FA7F|nr:MtN3-like protein [Phytophthora cinnamomi]